MSNLLHSTQADQDLFNPPKASKRLVRLEKVLNITGLSRSHVYNLAAKGEFPGTVKLSQRSVAWVEEEVVEWVNERIAERSMEMSR